MLDRYMKFIVPDANSRILGQQNIHFSILTVYDYWNSGRAQTTWGKYTILPILNRQGRLFAPWILFRVDNIDMGQGFPISLYFWGQTTGVNTVVTRYEFWKLYFVSGLSTNLKNRLSSSTSPNFVPNPFAVGVPGGSPVFKR